jgi:hypothetical protein
MIMNFAIFNAKIMVSLAGVELSFCFPGISLGESPIFKERKSDDENPMRNLGDYFILEFRLGGNGR